MYLSKRKRILTWNDPMFALLIALGAGKLLDNAREATR